MKIPIKSGQACIKRRQSSVSVAPQRYLSAYLASTAPQNGRARKWAIQTELSTSITPALPSGDSPHLWLRPAQLSQTPGALALDQGFQALPDQRRPFLHATEALRFRKQLILYVQRSSQRSLRYLCLNQHRLMINNTPARTRQVKAPPAGYSALLKSLAGNPAANSPVSSASSHCQ